MNCRGSGIRVEVLTYKKVVGEVKPPPSVSSLYLSLRDILLEDVCSDIIEDSPAVQELASRIRAKIPIYKMNKHEAFKRVAGVDAGSQILPLASRRYAVMSALVYSLPSGSKYFLEPESLSFPYTSAGEKYLGVVNIRREAKLYETACRFIEDKGAVDLLLIDGPLAFSNWWKMAGEPRDRQRLIKAINKLVILCQETDTLLAGVVKRPSARYLVFNLDLQRETDLPDSYLLHHALMPGERTEIFSPRTAVRKAVQDTPFMDAIRCPIYSYYCRPSKDWSITPVRIDIPAFSLGHLDEILDYCYSTSFWNGIPLPILKADEEVKITKRFIKEVYGDMISRVGRETGDLEYLVPYWGERSWMGA